MSKLENHPGSREQGQEAAAVMLTLDMTITAPALFIHSAPDPTKTWTPNPIYFWIVAWWKVHWLQFPPGWKVLGENIKHEPVVPQRVQCWSWLIAQFWQHQPALHSSCCVKGGGLEAPLPPSAGLGAQKASCKSSCYIYFPSGFSLHLLQN